MVQRYKEWEKSEMYLVKHVPLWMVSLIFYVLLILRFFVEEEKLVRIYLYRYLNSELKKLWEGWVFLFF